MNLILPTITTKLINWHMKETSKCGQELYYGSYTKWIPVEPSSLPRRFDHRGKCWSEWKWIIPQDILLTFRYSISIQITCLSILIHNNFCIVEIIHFHSHFPLSIERPNTQWQPKYIVALSILCTLFFSHIKHPRSLNSPRRKRKQCYKSYIPKCPSCQRPQLYTMHFG